MVQGRKKDFAPLLPPGRHYLSLQELKTLTVDAFPGNDCRSALFTKLEEMYQAFLTGGLVCEFYVDGSFVTEKEKPDDVDVTVIIEHEFADKMTSQMNILVDEIVDHDYSDGLSSTVFFTLPSDHRDYRTEHDLAYQTGCTYGAENSEEWCKGFVILTLNETNVGLRIRCR